MTRKSDPRETRHPIGPGELPDFTPVPRLCQRHDGWTAERQFAFIEALADTGSVKAAAAAVNMSAEGAYYLRRQKGAESFRKAWEVALSLGVQRIEDVAMDRALNGVDVPVYSYGKLVGMRKNYNDRLLMFMLRNRASDRFAEGKPRAMSAMDLTRLDQEKKKWRREWELEQQAARPQVSSQEVRDSIERKIKAVRQRVEADRKREWEALSDETREAWQRFEALKARDLGEQPLLSGNNRTEGPQGRPPAAPYGAKPSDADASRPASEGENKQHAETKDSPKIRRLKDEGWS